MAAPTLFILSGNHIY